MINLAKKDELKILLRVHGISLEKSLGQHFLVDEKVLDEIIEKAQISKNDFVLETGAGVGTLTVCLAEKSEKVLAVELDARVFPILKANLGVETTVEILQANALDIAVPEGKWKWVANLPYQITAPLLKKFLGQKNPPSLAVLMVQKEFGEKICAEKESRISLLVKNFMKVSKVVDVSRESFFPEPKVDSVVLKLEKKENPVIDLEEWQEVEKIMKLAFLGKRKKLRNTLKPIFGKDIQEKLETVGMDPDMRPENIKLEAWKKLAERI